MDTQLQANNYYLNETLQGIPEDIAALVQEALALLDSEATSTRGVEAHLTFVEKIDRVRYAAMLLVNYLVEHRMGMLNPSQRLFLNTGAITDVYSFKDETGEQHQIQILDPEVYLRLRQVTLEPQTESLPAWSQSVYRYEDQLGAIALGLLEPEGLDKKTLLKFRAAHHQDTEQTLSREQAKILNATHQQLVGRAKELFARMESLLNEYKQNITRIPRLDESLRKARHYNYLVGLRGGTPEEREEAKQILTDPAQRGLSEQLALYADQIIRIMQPMKECSLEIEQNSVRLREVTGKLLLQAGAQNLRNVRERQDIVFDEESIRLIKNHVYHMSNYAASGARQSPLRIAESTSRVLLDVHTKNSKNPLAECYATVPNVTRAFEKVMQIHSNLFELDASGQPVVPQILIEPVRNYVEWTDQYFVIGFVSGDQPREGVHVSFSSLEMSVLRACGMYAFKDKIFDYRGHRLDGSLMSDYSARLESQTAVKWVGDDKKYKLMTVVQEVDAASRTRAIQDYVEFMVHAANNFPAPLSISKRKLAVLLKYIVVVDLERTIALLLRYVADKEPEEARDVLLWHAGQDRERAFQLMATACQKHQNILNANDLMNAQKVVAPLR
jgi:hypothetical protein